MKFSSFTFLLTDKCNFQCSYCFQKREEKELDSSSIKKALDFFFPYLEENSYINFSGGEPLLAFEQIREAVDYIQDRNKDQKKPLQYYMVTNGSLINDEILYYLKKYKFSLLLSFDGLAQDLHRKKGSSKQLVPIIRRLLAQPEINLEVSYVVTPTSVGYLSKSIQFMIELGIPTILLSLAINSIWNDSSLVQLKKEFSSLRSFLLLFYKKKRIMPLDCMRKVSQKGIFACFGGFNRMTLAPDRELWGCYLFRDYIREKKKAIDYQKYCFGDLDKFTKEHRRIYPEVLKNHAKLRMDNFYTDERFCMQCPELQECVVCPPSAAFSSSVIGKISGWACKYRKIVRKERELFWNEWASMKEDQGESISND